LGKVFGTAGIRGVFNSTQTADYVYRVAETIGSVFGKGRYCVGWDGRKTSALLARSVAAALCAVGYDVSMFGMVPTPTLAFGARSRKCVAGFSVTASHNPPEFSGVKVFNSEGMELAEDDEQRIERALVVGAARSSGRFGTIYEDGEVLDDYVSSVIARFRKARRPLRIAVDCANGPGGLVTPRVLAALGHEVVPVNAQTSWAFPARQPEPTQDNLVDFCRVVSQLGVDLGFAHDGDADRLVMTDGGGDVLPDYYAAIIALHGLGTKSGTVVLSENTSSAVEEEARKLGFDVRRSRIGKSFVLLREVGGVFATEPSKIVDPTWGYWEDGINAAALISSVLSEHPELLSEIKGRAVWHYRQTSVSAGAKMRELIPKAREVFKRLKIAEERMLDGYKIVFNDGSWVMFRRSGTEQKTRLYCEAKSQTMMDLLIQEGLQCIESSL
jgi:phosphomannomutase